MTESPREPDADPEAQALNNGVARVRETTQSIGGRCSTPPPASFNLVEPVPPGACAILVEEDFLDVPVGNLVFWLDSVYVAMASPGTSESSVLVLQVDGLLWMTNCVLQGAGNNSRAVDVTTKDEGLPQMYVQGSTISSFTRPLAPGIIVWEGASLTLDTVTFRNLSLTPSLKGEVARSPAVTAFAGAGLLMQDVSFEDNTVYGQPAEFRAVSIAAGPPAAMAFAAPPFFVWLEPSGPKVMTQQLRNSSAFELGFLDDSPLFSSIQAERNALINDMLGPLPAAPAPAPAPALAPSPTPAPALAAVAPAVAPPVGTTQSPIPQPAPPQRPVLPLPPVQPDASPTSARDQPDLSSVSTERGPDGESAGSEQGAGDDGDDDDGVRVGLVVACAVAAAVAAALCVAAAALAVLRRRRQQLDADEQAALQEPQAAVGNWPYNDSHGTGIPAK